ncbi:MAG: zinc dependent phospholipase C family protein [Candidatus Riflebacteria bacterium]|nr:zinc dependent phospholipase C family protein [Candidatus Riflebacteria bacterium]
MPKNADIYKAVLGDELFAALTSEISTGQNQFNFDNLNKSQLAFLSGAVGPDAADKKYHFGLGFPIHKKYPQNALNIINDLSSQDKMDKLVSRAFFYGWTFHYIADLVTHPGLNKGNQYREGRDYAIHPPQHTIFEGLIDRVCINYFFLLNRDKKIAPSTVIDKAKNSPLVEFLFKDIPNEWCKAGTYTKEHLKACGKALSGLLKTDLGDYKAGLKEAEDTLDNADEKVQFLKSALYDENLKKFVAQGVPEADIMAGKAQLNDYFPTDPVVKSVCTEAIGWWKEIMKNTPKGFQLAPTRSGFACSLDYGNTVVTPEPPLSDSEKGLVVDCYEAAMKNLR